MRVYAGPVGRLRPARAAFSLSYNLAIGLASGTAPMAAVYLIVIAALSLLAAVTMKERRGVALN